MPYITNNARYQITKPNQMLAWFRQLVEDPHDHQPTVYEHGYDVVQYADTEPTATDYVQAVVHKSLCYSSWYARRFARGMLYVIEHMPDAPPLHTIGD